MKLKLLNQHEIKLLAALSPRYTAYFACRLASALAVYVVIFLAYFTSALLFFYSRLLIFFNASQYLQISITPHSHDSPLTTSTHQFIRWTTIYLRARGGFTIDLHATTVTPTAMNFAKQISLLVFTFLFGVAFYSFILFRHNRRPCVSFVHLSSPFLFSWLLRHWQKSMWICEWNRKKKRRVKLEPLAQIVCHFTLEVNDARVSQSRACTVCPLTLFYLMDLNGNSEKQGNNQLNIVQIGTTNASCKTHLRRHHLSFLWFL